MRTRFAQGIVIVSVTDWVLQEVFTAIYEGFAGIVMGACVWDENDYVTLSARCEALWQYLWEHRARLSASGHTTLRGIVCLVGVFTHVNKLRYVQSKVSTRWLSLNVRTRLQRITRHTELSSLRRALHVCLRRRC